MQTDESNADAAGAAAVVDDDVAAVAVVDAAKNVGTYP